MMGEVAQTLTETLQHNWFNSAKFLTLNTKRMDGYGLQPKKTKFILLGTCCRKKQSISFDRKVEIF
jgi:hypothetical protein